MLLRDLLWNLSLASVLWWQVEEQALSSSSLSSDGGTFQICLKDSLHRGHAAWAITGHSQGRSDGSTRPSRLCWSFLPDRWGMGHLLMPLTALPAPAGSCGHTSRQSTLLQSFLSNRHHSLQRQTRHILGLHDTEGESRENQSKRWDRGVTGLPKTPSFLRAGKQPQQQQSCGAESTKSCFPHLLPQTC